MRHHRCLSLTNSLSCGVLLGTLFLGMWPAAQAKWTEALEAMQHQQHHGRHDMRAATDGDMHSGDGHLPWHNLVVLVGFSVLFCLQNAFSKSEQGDDDDDGEEEGGVSPFP